MLNLVSLVLLALVGCVCVLAGLYLIFPPLALIGAGSVCVGVALKSEVRDR